MDFNEIFQLDNEFEKVSAIYDIFDESMRLESKSAKIEFIISIKYIEQHLKPGMRILDLGSGTGRYSLYLAQKGYEVVSVELVKKHADSIEKARTKLMNLTVIQGDAVSELKLMKENSFDCILCFGPLYHLEKVEERIECIKEINRVCTNNCRMYFAFINNDMVITTETICYDKDFIVSGNYNKDTFKVDDFPFVFYTVDGARNLLKNSGLTIEKEIASDGMNELLRDKINKFDDETYKHWVKYHLYLCEKPEFLGSSNHLLFVCRK